MKDKIAYIVTFHCVPNYGAVLQTYGLQEYLKTVVKEVRILDYRPNALLKDYRNINYYSVGSVVMSLYSMLPFLAKKRAFSKFEKRMNLSVISGTQASDFKKVKCDYLFCGSDQIWNPNITCGFDPVYFGAFSMNGTPKVISYAASLGKSIFSNEEISQMGKLLGSVDDVSVRENKAQKILADSLGINSVLVADPTILAGSDVFQSLVKNVKYRNYLFIYTLTNNPMTLQVAKQVATKKGLLIVQVSGNRKSLGKSSHIIIYDAGPEEFLSLLYHADFVVTDSFHGTVFANLFHVPYITIPHKTRGSRMDSLLTELDMKNRLTENSDICESPIDWSVVEKNICRLREQSIQFISQSL